MLLRSSVSMAPTRVGALHAPMPVYSRTGNVEHPSLQNEATCHRTRERPSLPGRTSTSTKAMRHTDLVRQQTTCKIIKVNVGTIAGAVEVLGVRCILALVFPQDHDAGKQCMAHGYNADSTGELLVQDPSHCQRQVCTCGETHEEERQTVGLQLLPSHVQELRNFGLEQLW